VAEVFERCLETNTIEERQREVLRGTFFEITAALARQDSDTEEKA